MYLCLNLYTYINTIRVISCNFPSIVNIFENLEKDYALHVIFDYYVIEKAMISVSNREIQICPKKEEEEEEEEEQAGGGGGGEDVERRKKKD